MSNQYIFFILFLAINSGLWMIFNSVQQSHMKELQTLILDQRNGKKYSAPSESEKQDSNDKGDKIVISKEFIDWYKNQGRTRADYVKTTVNQEIYNVLAPEAYCPRMRLGRIFDGGKWICDPINVPDGCVIFSLGIAGRPSFDEEIQKYTNMRCKIYGYDRSPASISEQVFKSINGASRAITLAKVTDASKGTSTIEDLMKLEKVDKIEILKIDIEGAEFEVMTQFLQKQTVCQILIEIHSTYDGAKNLLREIARFDYLLFNFEINPNSPFTATEFSFIHKSCMQRYSAIELYRYLP
ncbi:hypothetical protein WR25_07471 [Diploscapter pachys]|uniref:Methyltransferase domain-containing protein n=1 Tax=Diploscapter pachys TaxID=2018661 RepID=A0A2A2LRM3_9BILA|nr:hypothetical protein WR25_07471 [Diploscapter pachys]